MRKYRLISSDLDGTLLDSNKQVSAENRLAIREFTEAGGFFVPNSGRSLYEISPEVRNLPGVRFLICSDGADIYDKETDAHIRLGMNREETAQVYAELDGCETFFMLHYDANTHVDADRMDDETMIYHGLDRFFRAQVRSSVVTADFEHFRRTREDTEMICVFFHDLAERQTCREKLLRRGFCVVSTAPHNLEIFSLRAGKGNAIAALAAHLGIPKEEIIAVGDGENDAAMFDGAGLGLATENACDLLKDAADAIICNNDEHIVLYILKKYVK